MQLGKSPKLCCEIADTKLEVQIAIWHQEPDFASTEVSA